MKTEIPNAEYIRAILDGKEVEYESREHWESEPKWRAADLAIIIGLQWLNLRIKPEPKPKREPRTVYVYRNNSGCYCNNGSILLLETKKNFNDPWQYLGEFILQPKEQT